MIYLTSFKKSDALIKELPKGTFCRYSAAVYQPGGYELPKMGCWDIRMKSGQWIRPRIRPREFVSDENPLIAYRKALFDLYDKRAERIDIAMNRALAKHPNVVLCCWCPYEKAAQRQIKEFGSFVCHLSVVAAWLKDHSYKNVWLDSDRLNMAVLTQKGGSLGRSEH